MSTVPISKSIPNLQEDTEKEENKFLLKEYFKSSFNRTLFKDEMRNSLYNFSNKDSFLIKMEPIYKNLESHVAKESRKYFFKNVNEIEHIESLKNIANSVSKDICKTSLKPDRYPIATVQFIFNHYLKMLWSSGFLNSKPPHCLINNTVLKILGKHSGQWYMVDDISIYLSWIDHIKKIATENNNHETIFDWQLVEYNKFFKDQFVPRRDLA